MKRFIWIIAFLLFPLASNAYGQEFKDTMLTIHNYERQLVGVSPLKWDDDLERDAKIWADYLAKTNNLEHSNTAQGENLWQGTAGVFKFDAMAQGWADEKSNFVYGIFPKVSKTSYWTDVGHYTQMIWQNTTQIGCAYSTNSSYSFAVCRYNPSGNYTGQKPY